MPDPFPPGFFARLDESPDEWFYDVPRLVTHLDERAIAAVGALYEHLGLDGRRARRVLDLMSSWISHFRVDPPELTVLGLNQAELEANRAAATRVVHDLNAAPRLPFGDASFDAAVCCASVDYLVEPVAVFAEVGRVLVPGAIFCVAFSNRLFPTKAVAGWLQADDAGRCAIVAEYFRRSGAFDEPRAALVTPPGAPGDPLYAVWAAALRSEP